MTVTISKAENGFIVTQTHRTEELKTWIMDNFGEVIVFLARSFDEVDYVNQELDVAKLLDGVYNESLPITSDSIPV
jgi:hypothetical protein